MAKVDVKTFFKKNNLPALKKRLDIERSKSFVSIGFHEDEFKTEKKSEDGKPDRLLLGEVATFHEFGTEHVPERSFIRSNDAEKRNTYKKIIEQLKDKIIFEEMKITVALSLLGEKIRADIQQKIRSGIAPALKEATIKSKNGKSTPLIDTGQLINGITYQVGGNKK